MLESVEQAGEALITTSVIHDRDGVLLSPCPVPEWPGVYGWWFRTTPAE